MLFSQALSKGQCNRVPLPGVLLFVPLMTLALLPDAFGPPKFEQEIAEMFVGYSFTIRNFYQGNTLRYGSDGQLLGKAEQGYWSRDGMVQFSSAKLSKDNELIMQGKRQCILFEAETGEFSNVWTGDKVEIRVQLRPDQLSLKAAVPVLQKVLLTNRDDLAELVPPYWKNCIRQRVDRPDKESPWECVAADKRRVPDFARRKISWDVPPPDTSLRNGMQLYYLRHRVGYLAEEGVTPPSLLRGPDPFFQWIQRRAQIEVMTLVLALTIGENGKPRDIFIVSPVGMGLDDEAAEAVAKWEFSPGIREKRPYPVHARVVFDITSPNAR